jgi:hypothetical protein
MKASICSQNSVLVPVAKCILFFTSLEKVMVLSLVTLTNAYIKESSGSVLSISSAAIVSAMKGISLAVSYFSFSMN